MCMSRSIGNDEERPWGWRGLVTIGAVCVLLYVLSVGPAQWLCRRGVLSNSFMQTFYKPLEYVAGTGKDSLLNRYLGLWE
jgi:hypothetical protein